jgi:hypothetical protein
VYEGDCVYVCVCVFEKERGRQVSEIRYANNEEEEWKEGEKTYFKDI